MACVCRGWRTHAASAAIASAALLDVDLAQFGAMPAICALMFAETVLARNTIDVDMFLSRSGMSCLGLNERAFDRCWTIKKPVMAEWPPRRHTSYCFMLELEQRKLDDTGAVHAANEGAPWSWHEIYLHERSVGCSFSFLTSQNGEERLDFSLPASIMQSVHPQLLQWDEARPSRVLVCRIFAQCSATRKAVPIFEGLLEKPEEEDHEDEQDEDYLRLNFGSCSIVALAESFTEAQSLCLSRREGLQASVWMYSDAANCTAEMRMDYDCEEYRGSLLKLLNTVSFLHTDTCIDRAKVLM